jgi:hypothetical protein
VSRIECGFIASGDRIVPLFIAGLFRDRGQAERVVTSLLDAGVPSSEISFAAREDSEEDVGERNELSEEDTPFAELARHSAWERLGWQGGARPAYRDKVAPKIDIAFIAAGPVAIAIGGAQLGAAAGGLVGAIGNFGFTLEQSREWYNRLAEGRAWVCVRTSTSSPLVDKARKVFERYAPDMPAESTRHW